MFSDIHAENLDVRINKPRKTNHRRLNVFTYGWMPVHSWGSFWCNLWHNFCNIFRCFVWAWQRAFKGYCKWDTLDLNTCYLHYMIATLTDYRNRIHGYPPKHGTFDEFIGVIDQWINDLEWCLQIPEDLAEQIVGEVDWEHKDEAHRKLYFKTLKDIYDERNQRLESTFSAIGKELPGLWI